MLAAIDERTAIVPISHGIYVSGALQDVKAITARAHEVGALVMVDVYQTVGVVPIDVHEWDADIVVGGSHKWLCGGPGTAFMWMKPGAARAPPAAPHRLDGPRRPFAFEPAPIRYADDHRRFLAGTPSMPAYYVARAAYENLHAIGVDRIRAHNLALSHILLDRAELTGLTVHSPLDRRAAHRLRRHRLPRTARPPAPS
jgi:kynureninase